MAAEWMERLVRDGLISGEQLQEVLTIAKTKRQKVEKVLADLGYVSEHVVADYQSAAFGFETVDLEDLQVADAIVGMVPESVARENNVFPVEMRGESLVVALNDPMNLEVLDKLRFILNRDIQVSKAPTEDINAAINRHYGQQHDSESIDSMISEFTETQIEFTATELSQAESDSSDEESSPIVKLVNLIITEAVNMRASDIHIEPFEDRVRIRYRIDGVLVERDAPPRRLLGAMISRIKIMGSIDIAEKRKPQDGRIKTTINGNDFDLRVSVMPTNHGQGIVLRILDRNNIKVGIRSLGFSEQNYKEFTTIIRRPNGIFLVTGPTGSGKTTTLYSALGEMNRPDRKIITAEDPVEYYLPGINQVEVKHRIGLNFAKIIKAMLRQAPNIILVGEIRDKETAEIAIQASLTGHLVFSTLHTNDAPGSITRLTDMGVQSFLVASSIMAVMAQRLVRAVCPKCKEPYTPEPSELAEFDLTEDSVQDATFLRGKGCNHCQHTGYRGRRAVFELMMMNPTLRKMAFDNEPTQNIRRQARLLGMKNLVEDAVDKALKGVTTLTEAYKLKSGGH